MFNQLFSIISLFLDIFRKENENEKFLALQEIFNIFRIVVRILIHIHLILDESRLTSIVNSNFSIVYPSFDRSQKKSCRLLIEITLFKN